jgi:hypothetical protein
VSTVAGSHSRNRRANAGSHVDGRLNTPTGLLIDRSDRLVISNEAGHTIVRVDPHKAGMPPKSSHPTHS